MFSTNSTSLYKKTQNNTRKQYVWWLLVTLFIVLFVPPIGTKRYTIYLFIPWNYFLLKFGYFSKIRKLGFVSIAYVIISGMLKSFFSYYLVWDVFSQILGILNITGGYVAGYLFYLYSNKSQRFFLYIMILLQAILCIIQIMIPLIGEEFAKIYTTEKYQIMFDIWSRPRAIGTFGNPNYLGFLFVLFLPVIIGSFHKQKSFILFTIQFIVVIVAIYLTRSRAAIFSLVVLIILWLLFSAIEKHKIRENPYFVQIITLVIIFILLIGSYISFVNAPLIIGRVSDILGRNSDFYSPLLVRVMTWQNADLDQNNELEWFFGKATGWRIIVDNYYILLLMRHGVFGLFLISFLIIYMLKVDQKHASFSIKAYRKSLLVLFILVGFVADYWINSAFTPLYIFLVLSINGTRRKELIL